VGCLHLRSTTVNLSSLLLKFTSSVDCDLAVTRTEKAGKVAKRSMYQSTAITVRDTYFKTKQSAFVSKHPVVCSSDNCKCYHTALREMILTEESLH
jgi:hypothetical protein